MNISRVGDFEAINTESRNINGHHVLQATYRFDNGQGASVILGHGTYGVELAVTRFTGEGVDDYTLDYSTPITSDVIGWIEDEEELHGYLTRIHDLPPRSTLARDPETFRFGITRD